MSRNILNLGILAHVDAGKTTLTERLLHAGGVIETIGSVDKGTTQTDSLALERERGITIKSAVVSFAIEDVAVNLIDTPGHPDFIAEVERVLGVLDGVVLVVSAVEGVQPQTRLLMRVLQRLALPTLLFVNKLDRLGASPDATLSSILRRLTDSAVPLGSVRHAGTRLADFAPFGPDDRNSRRTSPPTSPSTRRGCWQHSGMGKTWPTGCSGASSPARPRLLLFTRSSSGLPSPEPGPALGLDRGAPAPGTPDHPTQGGPLLHRGRLRVGVLKARRRSRAGSEILLAPIIAAGDGARACYSTRVSFGDEFGQLALGFVPLTVLLRCTGLLPACTPSVHAAVTPAPRSVMVPFMTERGSRF